ncbi:hypothetical protein [Ilyomonas limi]|nr:hypothetical protein [Ilyomonas limi]
MNESILDVLLGWQVLLSVIEYSKLLIIPFVPDLSGQALTQEVPKKV